MESIRKISIITVCFNSEVTIDETIRSVLSQNDDECEIEYIIVDGGSTDKTIEIIESYAERISKWITELDDGLYDALNKGIKLASGDIIGILNSDDVFADKTTLSRIAQAFKLSGTDIIYADVDFIANNALKNIVRHYSSKFFNPQFFRFGFQPAHPTFYTRKRNFEKFGYYRRDLKIAGDFELMLRFIYINKLSFKYIEDTWVYMRTGGASTKSVKNKILLNREILLACRFNNVYSGYLLIYLKYLIKWWGFIFRR